MIIVVAPEPCRWLEPLVRTALTLGPVTVVAPWVAPLKRRRAFPGPRWRSLPGWTLVELGARLWAGGRTDRQLASRFGLRAWVDSLAARCLDDAELVIAPSLAARATFSAAARRGIPTLLVHDLPRLRVLHADLDRAAERHPTCLFLRRYRAEPTAVARQEAELVLAGAVAVGSRYARETLSGLEVVDLEPPALGAARPAGTGRVRLAGLAAARNGAFEALDLLRARPTLELVVRAGEGSEPELLRHPRVFTNGECDAVLAPAWTEGLSAEVLSGLPVVATRAACGPFLTEDVEVGDGFALAAAVDRALAGTVRPPLALASLSWKSLLGARAV